MIRRDGDLTPRRWHLSTSRANVMVGATRLTLMAERLAFVSISARPAPDGRAGRAASGARCGGFGSKETHPCLNPSCKFRRSGSRRAMALARKPDPRVCGSASIPSPRCAHARPVQRYRISACRRQSYRISGENDRLHPSNQFGSITGERHEKAVRSQANVRVKAKSAEERLPRNMLPSRMTARPLRPPGKDRRWMRTCGRLIGFSDRAWGAAAR